MKQDASAPFKAKSSDGSRSIQSFAEALAGTGKAIHLAGHSTGGVLIGHLSNALNRLGPKLEIKSLTLFAPACRIDFFEQNYLPHLLVKTSLGRKASREYTEGEMRGH